MKYYKVTNYKECHNGFQYKDGLNVLDEPFKEKGSCVSGGLYFTTLEHITEFYKYGIHLREVILPTNDPKFKMVVDPSGYKYRANMIILGKKYPLYDPLTYKSLNLDISKYKHIFDFASNVHSFARDIEFDEKTNKIFQFNCALNRGNHMILEYWLASGFEIDINTTIYHKTCQRQKQNPKIIEPSLWRRIVTCFNSSQKMKNMRENLHKNIFFDF